MVRELTADHEIEPIGLDRVPRLGWRLSGSRPKAQTGYRVLVSAGRDDLAAERGSIWDSGRVESSDQTGIQCSIDELAPHSRYFWTVRVWDEFGTASPWSDVAWWETGPLEAADWCGAQWISAPAGSEGTLLLRRSFDLDAPVSQARLYVCGLGYADVTINGRLVSDAVLEPPFTAYHRRVLYRTHDVTDLLSSGPNVLGVTLARGWFGLDPDRTLYWHEAPWLADPRLLLLLVLDQSSVGGQDAFVVSDSESRCHPGPVTWESVYAGERYDARLELPGWDTPGFDASSWAHAQSVSTPDGELESARVEPMRVTGTMRPGAITNPADGVYVARFPRMVCGWIRLAPQVAQSGEIVVRYGEKLGADGMIDTSGDPGLIVGTIQTDQLFSGENAWQPRFTYKGFQFVQIDGLRGGLVRSMIEACDVNTDAESIGEFECGDPTLNTIHDMTRRSIMANLHGMPEDTPVFEKRGWLGDAGATAEAAMNNFAMWRVYAKWLRDIADCQGDDGNLPDLAPSATPGGGHDPAWGSAYVLIPWQTYLRTGDQSLLAEHYDGMRRYLDYLTANADGCVPPALYGDWLPPGQGDWDGAPPGDIPLPTPPEGTSLTSAAYYYATAETLAKTAAVLGSDGGAFRQLAAAIRDEFNARFLDHSGGHYRTEIEAGFRQTSQAVPVAFGLVPDDYTERVVANLVDDVVSRGAHLNTGVLGTKALFPALSDHGHVDLAMAVATNRTYPGFGYWLDQGATTLWEAWRSPRSRNHHMFGSIDDWFVTRIAGIRIAEPGYAAVTFAPQIPSTVSWARASIETVRGPLGIHWRRSPDGELAVDVVVPPNTTYNVDHGQELDL